MSGFFLHAKEELLNGDIDIDNDNMKVVLVDLTLVTSAGVKIITDATDATPIVCTCASHGWVNGDIITIRGVTGNTNANGRHKIANITADTFELTNPLTDEDIAGNGTYGGTDTIAVNLSLTEDLDDIDVGARTATSSNLTGISISDGIIDFDNITFSSVGAGDEGHALIMYDDSPAGDADKTLIAIEDGSEDFPVLGNGGDITYAVNSSGFAQL